MSQIIVKERPILFSGAMVRALLDGSKTQTRRAIAGKHIFNDEPGRYKCHGMSEVDAVGKGREFGALFEDLRPEITPWFNPVPCPYGEVGDRLWVRETFVSLVSDENEAYCAYRADDPTKGQFCDPWPGWKPSIFMPRTHSRILLEITAVRCERLQDISEADASAEGATCCVEDMHAQKTYDDVFPSARQHYHKIWASINGPGSWAANPWVWVVEFRIIDPA